MAAWLRVGVVVACLVAASEARAATDAGADDVDALVKQLAEEHAALSTEDCTTACRALESIRRAADRICALDPGTRCTDARAKAIDAKKRVAEACPDCAIAQAPTPDEDRRAGVGAGAAAPSPPPPAARQEGEVTTKRGGCASCATTDGAPETGDLGVVLLAAWLASSRRRREKSSRRM